MNKTAIIIPSRLDAQRLPNKPLKLINNKEMILHVYEAAMKSNSGEVFVASPDEKIVDLVKKFGGKGILTKDNHETGTDRVFEVFKETLNSEAEIIVNLQAENRITICICDHQARDLLACVDMAMILSNGKVVAQDSPSNLVKNINAKNAYFGNSFKFN